MKLKLIKIPENNKEECKGCFFAPKYRGICNRPDTFEYLKCLDGDFIYINITTILKNL